MDPRVRELAWDVRKWAVRNYIKYCSSPHLNGMCAIASAELFRRIKESIPDTTSVKLGMAMRDVMCHVVLIVDNKKLVDVTATQFNARRKAVEVRPVFHLMHPWYWRIKETFESDGDLYVHQLKQNWPSWQICEVGRGERVS